MSKLAYALGRIFIPLIFIVAGYKKFMNIQGTAATLAAKFPAFPDNLTAWTGLPKFEALGYLAGSIELIGGIMLVIGFGTRVAAIVLCLFTLGTVYTSHDFWNMDGAAAAANTTQALKNLAIAGGLLLLAAGGGGPASLDGRRRAA